MSTFDDFVSRSGGTGEFSTTSGNPAKQLNSKGFEDPSEAALADLRARRKRAIEAGHGVVEVSFDRSWDECLQFDLLKS